jgi:uncharacterized protein
MDRNKRIQVIAEQVHGYLKTSCARRSASDRRMLQRYLLDHEYRWRHTLRVAQFGKVIAETEEANVEQVILACLLHDIAWFDTPAEKSIEHGRVGARIAEGMLASQGCNAVEIAEITEAIAAHVDVDNPGSLTAKILSDADNVDRYGPYRILQWCFADIKEYDKLAIKLNERLQRLEAYRSKNPLHTPTGRQLFEEQLDLQIAFFSGFVGEKEICFVPTID